MDDKHIGVDESGKGDYFGFLVIAGVVTDKRMEKKLIEMGVKDSKKLQDSSALRLSTMIMKTCVFDVVKISPERYNALYGKFGKNLNKLLAWGHARVIENLLEKEDVKMAVVDKFGDNHFVSDALMEKGKRIKVVQRIKAEDDIAVAAASILARAEFLRTLKKISLEVGYKLPKGSTEAEKAAIEIVEKYGEKILPLIAKTHFRITKRVLEKKGTK